MDVGWFSKVTEAFLLLEPRGEGKGGGRKGVSTVLKLETVILVS